MTQPLSGPVCLFIGPSLSGAQLDDSVARIPADVRVLPPVQQGDLLRLRDLDPSVVAIVDGAFFQVPSITHKEILLTLERGVRVLGASSLGALRAAELDVFGMEGVGEIYRLYKRGVIDGDDEVALAHAESVDGYAPMSEPLVNIRHNLSRARKRGLISRAAESAIVGATRKLHFTQRSYAAAATHAPDSQRDSLAEFFRKQAEDVKRSDALALLQVLADRFSGAQEWPAVQPVKTHRTVYLHLFEREYVGCVVADARVASFYKLWSPNAPHTRNQLVLRCLALDAAAHRGIPVADCSDELGVAQRDREVVCSVLRQYGSARALVTDVAQRLGVPWQALLAAPRMRPGIPWDTLLVRELKLSGDFRPVADRARQVIRFAEEMSAQVPGYAESLSCSRLEAWFAAQWGVRSGMFGRALVRRGFDSYREFIDVARPAYVFDRLAP
jgi:hypothetical protein